MSRTYEHWTDDKGTDALLPAEHGGKSEVCAGLRRCCEFDAKNWGEAMEAYRKHYRQKAGLEDSDDDGGTD